MSRSARGFHAILFTEMRIEPLQNEGAVGRGHAGADERRRKLLAGNIQHDAFGKPTACGERIRQCRAEMAGVAHAGKTDEQRLLQCGKRAQTEPVIVWPVEVTHEIPQVAAQAFLVLAAQIGGRGGRGQRRRFRQRCALFAGWLDVAQGDQRIDDGRRQVFPAHDRAGMGLALGAGDEHQHFIGKAGRTDQKRGGNADGLAGDEQRDRFGHVGVLGKGGDGLPASFFGGSIEERAEQFGELSQLGTRGMGERLEVRHGCHQHHVLPPQGLGFFKISETIGHGNTCHDAAPVWDRIVRIC